MFEVKSQNDCCIIIGASHAGINAAFSLRKEGWQGAIKVFDADPTLPYHRPPLSKAYLTSDNGIEKNLLKAEISYQKSEIDLHLGISINHIDAINQSVATDNGQAYSYNKLIIATGARPFTPPIDGINSAHQLYPLRTAADVNHIRAAMENSATKRVVIIGGGYIGLETAASLKKLGASVTVLEREERILARVTAPLMSKFFQQLHSDHGVDIFTSKDVSSIEPREQSNLVVCKDGSEYPADIIVVGAGIRVNTELAAEAGINIDNGIVVNGQACTSAENIYAIGDCSYHHNPHYDRFIRLESVQNAVDQAKIAAASICGKEANYDTLPWFWSDQYDVKLQMVGLASGYNNIVVRQEPEDNHKFSVWYFKDETLLAVDAINHAKAYVVATKMIKSGAQINLEKLADHAVTLHPDSLI
jgi:3-phenylpropionate/trans-cinnamate dioxygenase ferredoxin reductase subunit